MDGKWKGRVLAGDDSASTGGNASIVGVEDPIHYGSGRLCEDPGGDPPRTVWVATKVVLMRTYDGK